MKEIFYTTLANFIDYDNRLPRDFNNKIYWNINNDLHNNINYHDTSKIYDHWLNYGYNENRRYSIPDELIYKFDYRVYYYLYDDVKKLYKSYNNYGLLCHYFIYGIKINRICSIDEIHLPDNYVTDIDINNIKNISEIIVPKSYLIKLNYYINTYINTNIFISIILLLDISDDEYNFMYNLWLKNIISNDNITIIRLNKEISLFDQIKNINYDWILYSNKKILINI